MTNTQKILSLIEMRQNGDLTAQSKIDVLFSNVKPTQESINENNKNLIAQSNALTAQG